MKRQPLGRSALYALAALCAAVLVALVITRAALDRTRSRSAQSQSSVSNRRSRTLAASVPLPLFAPSSPLNQSIPANAPIDPRSDQLVTGLAETARQQPFVIAVKRWTVPVYFADATTPRYRVFMRAPWAPRRMLSAVPIPSRAAPDPAGDHHLAILDERTGCEYDFWEARNQGDRWSAAWGNSLRISGSGIYPHGLSARGSGFGLLAGLIWPQELARGSIDHALVFSYPYTSAAGFVSPATESDGRTKLRDAIPEGARLQLDPGFDVSSLPPYERTIARALQRYGMYLADTGAGNVSLYAVNPQSYTENPYAGIFPAGAYAYLRDIPLDRFRVLEHGSVIPRSKLRLAPSGCGKFR